MIVPAMPLVPGGLVPPPLFLSLPPLVSLLGGCENKLNCRGHPANRHGLQNRFCLYFLNSDETYLGKEDGIKDREVNLKLLLLSFVIFIIAIIIVIINITIIILIIIMIMMI